ADWRNRCAVSGSRAEAGRKFCKNSGRVVLRCAVRIRRHGSRQPASGESRGGGAAGVRGGAARARGGVQRGGDGVPPRAHGRADHVAVLRGREQGLRHHLPHSPV
ncbi:unnamed protein product, partial [Closterium sp. NIES-53]